MNIPNLLAFSGRAGVHPCRGAQHFLHKDLIVLKASREKNYYYHYYYQECSPLEKFSEPDPQTCFNTLVDIYQSLLNHCQNKLAKSLNILIKSIVFFR